MARKPIPTPTPPPAVAKALSKLQIQIEPLVRNAAADPGTAKALAAWLRSITSDPDVASLYGGQFQGTTIDPGVAGAILVELLIRGVLREGVGHTLAREASSRIGKSSAGRSLAAFLGQTRQAVATSLGISDPLTAEAKQQRSQWAK